MLDGEVTRVKNIVLIVVDTLRADRLGCYGYGRETSSHLDALAAAGWRLEELVSASNFTAPAMTSLLTARDPVQHGVFDFRSETTTSFPYDIARRAGYRVGGAVAFRFLKRLLARAWGPLEVVTEERTGHMAADLPEQVTNAGLEWLDAQPEAPFCLFLHYNGPHMPYRLGAPSAGRFGPLQPEGVDPDLIRTFAVPAETPRTATEAAWRPRMRRSIELIDLGLRRLTPPVRAWFDDRYDEAVRDNDAAVGRLLQGLNERGLEEETVIGVVSDHGEELMQHGSLTHGGIHLYQEVIRTVGLVRAPGGAEGRVCRAPLSHVEFLPLLFALALVPGIPDAWRRLPSLLDADGREEPLFCVGEYKTAVRQGRWKLIHTLPLPVYARAKRLRMKLRLLLRRELGDELYDLVKDPGETRNLRRKHPEVADRLRRQVRGFWRRMDGGDPPASGMLPGSRERKRIEEEMRELGYL